MWNARRLLILVGAFGVFLGGYTGYAYFLGGIDGLPPLPTDYHPPAAGEVTKTIVPSEPDSTRKMRFAFGPDCEEVKRHYQLDLRSKGWVVSFQEIDFLDDGRVKLWPFSAALFPKDKQKAAEINTVQCGEAICTLDRPVTAATQLQDRKVIGIELRGPQGITVINNRGTLEKNDDIELLISGNPLFFDERRNLVWTEGFIKLIDKQTKPHPTQVTAKGLDIQLAREAPGATPAKTKSRTTDSASFVELLILRANVEMHVWVDSSSGFLATGKETKPAADTAAEKSQLIIKTPGTFTYNVPKDMASFDGPTGPAATECEVHVSREQVTPTGKRYDQLFCDSLVLHFRRAIGEGARDNRAFEKTKEIESAQATARSGKEVIITMDAEKLEAHGAELIYRSATASEGPKTILKGKPMRALKEGHKVEAAELHLTSEKSGGQKMFAVGPGRIDLYDKAKDRYSLHATWKKSLTSAKHREGDKVLDILNLTGDAGFIDDEHGQELHGEKLIVWLEPADTASSKRPEDKQDSLASRQKPAKVEAYENVRAESAEFRVLRAEHLEIRFVKEAGERQQKVRVSRLQTDLGPVGAPESSPAIHRWDKHSAAFGSPGGTTARFVQLPAHQSSLRDFKLAITPLPAMNRWATFNRPSGTATVNVGTHVALYAPQLVNPDPTKKRKPVELTARRIVCYVQRNAVKDELKELVTEGAVHVHQEADDPKDKGVDIRGEMLNLLRQEGGDVLYVFGDSRKPAQLQMGELIVIGPKVTINQQDNTAEVNGVGAMSMPAGSTTFDGSRASKPGARVTVHWSKEMLFNGQYANFYGGVMAYQENAYLRCQNLQVKLDRPMSFKEGNKGGPSPKVDKLICELKVQIKDEIKDANNKYLHHHRLEASQLEVDNIDGKTNASGPGKVFSLSVRGEGGPSMFGGSPKAPAMKVNPKGPDMMLTRIDYTGRLYSTTPSGGRLSTFTDNVEVHHVPADNPDATVNPDRPPKDGFYLRCETLQVLSRKIGDKTSQLMQAQNRVLFRTQDFYGRADVVKYDEAQDQIIFEGNPAVLAKSAPAQGQATQDTLRGTKILYNRRLGTFQLDGGNVISW